MCIVYYGESENLLPVHISWDLCMFTEWRRVGMNIYVGREAKEYFRK
jgi:hypothetical protein